MLFKNVKCGNETEGYIQYKSIEVFLSDSYFPSRTIFTFNKFFYDTAWSIGKMGSLHPHISDEGCFCFGNRKGDYTLYTEGRSYPKKIRELMDQISSDPDKKIIIRE